jgi:hypothetical protein
MCKVDLSLRITFCCAGGVLGVRGNLCRTQSLSRKMESGLANVSEAGRDW